MGLSVGGVAPRSPRPSTKALRQTARRGSSLVWTWSLGIDHFLRDDRLQARLDALSHEQVHGRSQDILQVELQIHVMVEGGLAQLHQDVNIAVGTGTPPGAGSKQTDPLR